MRLVLLEITVQAGKREEALALLREIVSGPMDANTANDLRCDPFLAPIRSDPRFEESLRSIREL